MRERARIKKEKIKRVPYRTDRVRLLLDEWLVVAWIGCQRVSSIQLDTMLRTTSEARVDTRLQRYYLVVLLLNIFTLACLLLSSI